MVKALGKEQLIHLLKRTTFGAKKSDINAFSNKTVAMQRDGMNVSLVILPVGSKYASKTSIKLTGYSREDGLYDRLLKQHQEIIRKHAVVRWRENVDAQNRMRNDLDDFLFHLQKEKGFTLSYAQMDAIIEAVIRIAMHRTDDV